MYEREEVAWREGKEEAREKKQINWTGSMCILKREARGIQVTKKDKNEKELPFAFYRTSSASAYGDGDGDDLHY